MAAGTGCIVWDVNRKEVVFKDQIHWPLHCCQFAPDGRLLVAAGEGRQLKRYTVRGPRQQTRVEAMPDLALFTPQYGPSYFLVFSTGGQQLFSIGARDILVFRVANWKRIGLLKGNSVALSQDGSRIAIGDSNRGTVKVAEVAKLLATGWSSPLLQAIGILTAGVAVIALYMARRRRTRGFSN